MFNWNDVVAMTICCQLNYQNTKSMGPQCSLQEPKSVEAVVVEGCVGRFSTNGNLRNRVTLAHNDGRTTDKSGQVG